MKSRNAIVLNTAQAAELVGLSVSTLAKMRLYGNGPNYVKLGRRVVYRVEDIEVWIAGNRFQSTSEYPVQQA